MPSQKSCAAIAHVWKMWLQVAQCSACMCCSARALTVSISKGRVGEIAKSGNAFPKKVEQLFLTSWNVTASCPAQCMLASLVVREPLFFYSIFIEIYPIYYMHIQFKYGHIKKHCSKGFPPIRPGWLKPMVQILWVFRSHCDFIAGMYLFMFFWTWGVLPAGIPFEMPAMSIPPKWYKSWTGSLCGHTASLVLGFISSCFFGLGFYQQAFVLRCQLRRFHQVFF